MVCIQNGSASGRVSHYLSGSRAASKAGPDYSRRPVWKERLGCAIRPHCSLPTCSSCFCNIVLQATTALSLFPATPDGKPVARVRSKYRPLRYSPCHRGWFHFLFLKIKTSKYTGSNWHWLLIFHTSPSWLCISPSTSCNLANPRRSLPLPLPSPAPSCRTGPFNSIPALAVR